MSEQQERLQAIVKSYRAIEELVPAQWSEGDIYANGIRQHYYRTGGDKPALLLLHGFNEYASPKNSNGTTTLSWLMRAGMAAQTASPLDFQIHFS